jgi:hypothetical protein
MRTRRLKNIKVKLTKKQYSWGMKNMGAMPFEFFVFLFAFASVLLYYGLTRASFAAALLGLGAFFFIGVSIGSDGLMGIDTTIYTYGNSLFVNVLSQGLIIGSFGMIMFAVIAAIFNHVRP